MADAVFVDTSAWYPAVVATHPDHNAVAAALQATVRDGHRIVTTNLVIMETHALLLHRVGRMVALTFARTIYEPPTVVVSSTTDLEQQAITDWIEPYADQQFSLADGVSFASMKARRISRVIALDSHFATAGFQLLPGPAPRKHRRR